MVGAEAGPNFLKESEETDRRSDAMAVQRAFASTREVWGPEVVLYLYNYLLGPIIAR